MADQDEGHPGWWDLKRTNEHARRQQPSNTNATPHFVAPSSYLRPNVSSRQSGSSDHASALDQEQMEALVCLPPILLGLCTATHVCCKLSSALLLDQAQTDTYILACYPTIPQDPHEL